MNAEKGGLGRVQVVQVAVDYAERGDGLWQSVHNPQVVAIDIDAEQVKLFQIGALGRQHRHDGRCQGLSGPPASGRR